MGYRAADDVYFSLLREQATPMFETLRTTAFPQTYRAMFGFCARTNFLKTAMFDMIDSDNPYAFKALFRCFSEHYLKFTYVFVRFALDKSDAPGRDYFAFCGAREMRQYAAAVVDAEELIGNRVVAELNGFVAKNFPEAAHLSADELRRIVKVRVSVHPEISQAASAGAWAREPRACEHPAGLRTPFVIHSWRSSK